MGTPSKRKRTELCLEDKVKLIKDSPGKSQRQLAEQYGIGKTQVKKSFICCSFHSGIFFLLRSLSIKSYSISYDLGEGIGPECKY